MNTRKAKFHRRLTSALCALALLLSLVPAAQAAGTPVVSNNLDNNAYFSTWANQVKSYLIKNGDGLTRVEYITSKETVIIEDYSSSFQLQSSRTISAELPRWGGFFAGQNYNFFIFGQNNPDESDSVEVIRIVKYDKSWNRLGQASVYGSNTKVPFKSGSVRCAESGGMLYIHTCHEMYKHTDGKNHQANMSIAVRQSDMQVTETDCTISGYLHYVSHSFNQFILVDSSGNLVMADHGDGSPRAIRLVCLYGAAGKENPGDGVYPARVDTPKFRGEIGYNETYARLGGLAETSNGYLIGYCHKDSTAQLDPFQIKLGYIAKNSMERPPELSSFQITQLTDYKESYFNVSPPTLVPDGSGGGYVLWSTWKSYGDTKHALYYTTYDANGRTGSVQNASGLLSDCQPIMFNGKVTWYTTNKSAPVFYTLDASGVTATPAGGSAAPGTPSQPAVPTQPSGFTDLSAKHWAYEDIKACVDMGIVSGSPDGSFKPEDNVTTPQFLAMLVRIFYKDELAAITTPAGEPWYYATNKVAEDTRLSWGLLVEDGPIYRFDMATVIDNYLTHSGAVSKISDQKILENYMRLKARDGELPVNEAISDWTFVARCMAAGIITGKEDGLFHGEQFMTRAEACVVINRLIKFANN